MSALRGRLGVAARQLATTASDLTSSHTGFVELREYVLKPEGIKNFLSATNDALALRKSLLPFLGMFSCDTGGRLNRVVHFYHYDDFDHRDRCRKQAANSSAWQDEYLVRSRTCVQDQSSSIFLPAASVLKAANATPIQHYKSADTTPGLYELRQYQLHPGYGSVPKLLEAFENGIPHKIAADPHRGELVYFGYTDVGVLNQVIELWRYSSAQDCINARQAARVVKPWKDAIATITPGVQWFQSSFLQPVACSPMQ